MLFFRSSLRASVLLVLAACGGSAGADAGPDATAVDGSADAGGGDLGLDAGTDAGGDDLGPDACGTGACGCPTGFYDLDGNPLTGTLGCEYACTATSTTDPIDPAFTDANCDGTDGVADACVYVSGTRGDDTAGSGTRTSPVRTVAHAIAVAEANGVPAVCLGGDVFAENVTMVSGISVYGGFDADDPDFVFRRSATVTSTIRAVGTAVLAPAVDAETHLEGVTIDAQAAATPGSSVYGVRLGAGTAMLFVRDDVITAAPGVAGVDGIDGVAVAVRATSGNDGRDGCVDAPCPMPNGAPAPTCATPGGQGGDGGYRANGTNGGPGSGGAGVGTGSAQVIGGATSCPVSNMGGTGGTGSSGGPGGPGATAAALGSVSGGAYVAASGHDGAAGVTGGSGAGGGGAGGSGGLVCVDDNGGGGGSGGCGGAGGAPGGGGGGGGGSFGVFVAAGMATVTGNAITTGVGGTGGAGGDGVAGQRGGVHGAGGMAAGSAGAGGRGGDGGDGGPGGGGSGGTGGASACVAASSGATVTVTTTGCTAGLGGAPGAGGTNPLSVLAPSGLTGASAPRLDLL